MPFRQDFLSEQHVDQGAFSILRTSQQVNSKLWFFIQFFAERPQRGETFVEKLRGSRRCEVGVRFGKKFAADCANRIFSKLLKFAGGGFHADNCAELTPSRKARCLSR